MPFRCDCTTCERELHKAETCPSSRRVLSAGDMARLVTSARAEDDKAAGAAILVKLLTGRAMTAILRMRWEDLDLEHARVSSPNGRGENSPWILPRILVDILQSVPRVQDSPYVFPSPTNPAKPRSGVRRVWARVRSAAGLAWCTFRDTRRALMRALVVKQGDSFKPGNQDWLKRKDLKWYAKAKRMGPVTPYGNIRHEWFAVLRNLYGVDPRILWKAIDWERAPQA